MHSPLATRSFVPSSDGTFNRLGRRRRREDADKQSKLSVGAKESSLYGIIARTAIGFGGVDRRRITGGRKVCPRNDTRTRNRTATKASARGRRAPALTDGIQSNPGKYADFLHQKEICAGLGKRVGGICLGINTNWRMCGDSAIEWRQE
jgi:hypothetical protein